MHGAWNACQIDLQIYLCVFSTIYWPLLSFLTTASGPFKASEARAGSLLLKTARRPPVCGSNVTQASKQPWESWVDYLFCVHTCPRSDFKTSTSKKSSASECHEDVAWRRHQRGPGGLETPSEWEREGSRRVFRHARSMCTKAHNLNSQ